MKNRYYNLVTQIIRYIKRKEISTNAALGLINQIKVLPKGKSLPGKDIAVIGMACRFPGAENIDQFRDNLKAGREFLSMYPAARCGAADRFNAQWGGFIPDIECFDAGYFDIPMKDAKLMDPQQRLFLETAAHTFQHAGYSKPTLAGSRVAVIAGARMSTYQTPGEDEEGNVRSSLTGNIANFIATRVSQYYDLTGPAFVIDTACSSSLVAVHYACRSLNNRECTMALAGGINLHITPASFSRLLKSGALAPGKKSYAFDKRADGFLPGEGSGAVLLKPLAAAVKDGDTIYAVIKGSAVNNDGYTMGITTPNYEQQKNVITSAYENAGLSPDTISYLEAHGTGTAIGDPIEIKALVDVLRSFTDKTGFCGLGSVKTNIGHLDTASGIAGLIKVVLALYHGVIPPTLNCDLPNPRLNFLQSPFYPVSRSAAWDSDTVRRAGISSFGFGGTNCHAVLEAPPCKAPAPARPGRDYRLLLLSGRDSTTLFQWSRELAAFLAIHTQIPLQDVCYTMNTGRDMLPVRLAAVFSDREELLQILKDCVPEQQQIRWPDNTPAYSGQKIKKSNPEIVFIFPDADICCFEMGHAFFTYEPVFQSAMSSCCRIISESTPVSIPGFLYDQAVFNRYKHDGVLCRLAVFAVNYALARLWESWGVKPAVVCGYGAGKYNACLEAGALTLASVCKLLACKDHVEFAGCLSGVSFSALKLPLVDKGTILKRGTLCKTILTGEDGKNAGFKTDWQLLVNKGYRLFLECAPAGHVEKMSGPACTDHIVLLASGRDGESAYGTVAHSLAKLFINGYDIDIVNFEKTFPGQRISLPLYPFKRTRAWIEQAIPPGDSAVITEQVRIACEDNVLLHDHIVLGDHVLPAVCYWQMIAGAFALKTGKKNFELNNVIHQNALVIRLTESKNVSLTFTCGTAPRFKIEAGGMVLVSGSLAWAGEQAPGAGEDLSIIKRLCRLTPINAGTLYARFNENGIVYGPALRCIKKLWGDEQYVFAALSMPGIAGGIKQDDSYYAALLDCALQSIAGITGHQGKEIHYTYVPFFVGKVRFFSQLARQCFSLLRLVSGSWGAETMKVDISVMDAKGKIGASISGLQFKHISTPDLAKTKEPASPVPKESSCRFYIPGWIEQPPADREKTAFRYVVIFCKDEPLHRACIAGLAAEGKTIITVKPGKDKQRLDTFAFRIDPLQQESYRWLMNELNRQQLVPEQIIHLWTYYPYDPAESGSEKIMQSQFSGCFSLFYIIKAMAGSLQHKLEIRVVSSNTCKVLEADRELAPGKAPLTGILKTVALEYAHTRCEYIDLPYVPDEKSPEFTLLLAELTCAIGAPETALRGNSRFIKTFKPLNRELIKKENNPLKQGGVYIITGGLGGLGFALAEFLARNYQARLVLVSRRAFPARQDWEKSPENAHDADLQTRRIRIMKEWETSGAECLVCRGDVAEKQSMLEVLGSIKARGWELSGIFHAAGIVRDRLLLSKTLEDFTAVMRPKILGTLVLKEVFGSAPLDFFILFSSITSQFGSTGQADYAAANAFLDCFAHSYAPAMALNWTLWAETGMGAAPEIAGKNARLGIKALGLSAGFKALEDVMRFGCRQVLILNNDIETIGRQEAAVEAGIKQPIKALGDSPGMQDWLLDAMIRFLAKKVADLFETNAEEILTDENFLELGLDSLKLIGISDWLSTELAVTLYPTLLFEYPTITELAGYLCSRHHAACYKLFPMPAAGRSKAADDGADIPLAMETGETSAGNGHTVQQTVVNPEEAPLLTDWIGDTSLQIMDSCSPGNETKSASEPIAVIGMAGRFPGAANLNQYWQNCEQGLNRITTMPPARRKLLLSKALHPADGIFGGFLDDIEFFDPVFFNMSPLEADYIDPQQRLFLETVWRVFEDAGYTSAKLSRYRTGVFVGASQVEYRNIHLQNPVELSPYMGLGNALSLIANRISYIFNLGGPSLTVDTACSSSLAAIHLACSALRNKEAELAVAGGVQIYLMPDTFTVFSRAGMLAKDGRCKTFDKKADGYVRGEGVGAVLLKPLEKAIADHDTIYAVIKGSAMNHDGNNKVGISAPNPAAQKNVIEQALQNAQIDPETIAYLEAHGTGTSLGDPVEVNALAEVYGKHTAKKAFCALGTVKSQIGHLEACAGMAGFLHIVLAIKYKKIPPTINFNEANPHVPFAATPFYISDKLRDWPRAEIPRRAAVSAFGFGGTNCHIIVEEPAPAAAAPEKTVFKAAADVLMLSAKTETALAQKVDDLIAVLNANPHWNWHDICYTANTAREMFAQRMAVLADSPEQLHDRLEIIRLKGISSAAAPLSVFRGSGPAVNKKCAFFIGSLDTLDWSKADIALLDGISDDIGACTQILAGYSGLSLQELNSVYSFAFLYALVKRVLSLKIEPAYLLMENKTGILAFQVFYGNISLATAIEISIGRQENPLYDLKNTIPFHVVNQAFPGKDGAGIMADCEQSRIGVLLDFSDPGALSRKLPAFLKQKADLKHIPFIYPEKDPRGGLLKGIGLLFAYGIPLVMDALYKSPQRKLLPLPGYPFESDAYWLRPVNPVKEAAPINQAPASQAGAHQGKQSAAELPPITGKHPLASHNAVLPWTEFLKNTFSDILRIKREKLDSGTPFTQFGVDSLIIQAILKRIEAMLVKPVDPSLIMDYPTIAALAEVLDKRYGYPEQQQTTTHAPLEITAGESAAQSTPAPMQTAGAEAAGIAVIGFACHFPGAGDSSQFWKNLTGGIDSLGDIPSNRWDPDAVFAKHGIDPAAACRKGGFITGIDEFAASFFGITDNDAAVLDPQQRLLLEKSWETFEHAGYSKQALWQSRTGVFIGARAGTYKAGGNNEVIRALITGSISNFASARVSDFFNLRGPSLVFDTACSSSLVAVHYACRSILNGECNMALAGGVELKVHPVSYISLNLAKALSPDGKCHTFDTKANGFVPGEGIGLVLLKPLARAMTDGDTVYAVLKGSAINNDGHTMGITTPNMQAQEEVITLALENAGVNPQSVSYLEAHGTGTMIGDPIEVKALSRVFEQYTGRRGYCALGSVKTNIGHLDTAAGIASIIKVVLALYHRKIPPTLNCQQPNRRFAFIDSPFYPNTTAIDWERVDGVRRAGVSSFGFGGTNAHIILEEAPGSAPPAAASETPPCYLVALSAETGDALKTILDNYIAYIEKHDDIPLRDISFTANTGREHFACRNAYLARTTAELLENMKTGKCASGCLQEKQTSVLRIVLVFPAAGELCREAILGLYRTEPHFKTLLDDCSRALTQYMDQTLVEFLASAGEKSSPGSQLPLLINFAVTYALGCLWLSWIAEPCAVAGYREGELAAAAAAGAISFEDGAALAYGYGQTAGKPADVSRHPLKVHFISSSTGQEIEKGELFDAGYWHDHAARPGCFREALQNALEQGAEILLETACRTAPVSALSGAGSRQKVHLCTMESGKDVRQGITESLTGLYVHGVHLNFNRIQDAGGTRIALPTYPFERKKYWAVQDFNLQAAANQDRITCNAPAPFTACAEFSMQRTVYTCGFSPALDFVLQNHLVQEFPTLPATVYWNMALTAGAQALACRQVVLKNVTHALPFQPASKTEMTLRIILEHKEQLTFTIESKQPGKWSAHCTGIISTSLPEPQSALDLEAMKKNLSEHYLLKEQIYKSFSSIGLNYGSGFRSIEAVWFSGNQALARLTAPSGALFLKSVYPYDPVLLDGALQSVIAIRGYTGGEKSYNAYVPFFTEEIVVYGALTGHCYSHITLEEEQGGELIKNRVVLSDNSGNVLVLIRGFCLKKIPGAIEADLFYVSRWKQSALAARPANQKEPVMLFMHQDEYHAEFCKKLGDLNHPVIPVYSGVEYRSENKRYTINHKDPDHFFRMLSEVSAGHPLKEFIHLWTFSARRENPPSWQDIEAAQEYGILSLLYLVKALGRTMQNRAINLRIITSFSQVIEKPAETIAFGKSSLYGIMKVIAIEYRWINCFLCDMDPDSNHDWKDRLYEEITNNHKDPVTAYRQDQRWIAALGKLPTAEPVSVSTPLLRKRGTYLITGGLGGIGFELAGYLARNYQANLILLTRQQVGRREDTGGEEADRPALPAQHQERIKAAYQLESSGCKILLLQADVTNITDLEMAARGIKNRNWRLNGIFHLAGLIADKSMQAKDPVIFNQVLAPKIKGSWNLFRVFPCRELDFLLFFSSLSAVLGNSGQGDYAAANAFMDGFSVYLRAQGIPAQSINWPLWGETGMGVYSGTVKRAAGKGSTAISIKDGMAMLEKALRLLKVTPQIIVLYDKKMRELLKDHITDNTQPEPLQPASKREKIKSIEQYLAGAISAHINVSRDDIVIQDTFLDNGMDSVALVNMAAELEQYFNITLYPTVFFEYQTIASLAAYLFGKFGDLLPARINDHDKGESGTKQPAAVFLSDNKVMPAARELERDAAVVQPGAAAPVKNGDIAVVGLAGRFAGIDTLEEFWDVLKNGKDAIVSVPASRWDLGKYYSAVQGEKGKTYLASGGFLNGIDQFDAGFFNISPREAKEIDPQQRLILEVAYHTLEHGGYGGRKLHDSNTGVFVGLSYNQYNELLDDIGPFTSQGNSRGIIPNRFSYFMNFHGPSMVVDTLCSSSLVAVHLACRSLLNQECEFALAGGVFAVMNPIYFIGISNLGSFSPDGRCKTFDRSANGYVPGEGVGMVLLRPLQQALADNDTVYAVIKGSAVNHGGRANNLTAPNSPAQEQVIMAALKAAGVNADTISYLEAHGTGTALGDPVEVAGLARVFHKYNALKGSCAIGSVKTNIGHAEPAAGIAGLIKVILALQHSQIPPTIHFREPNPFLDILHTPFYINDKLEDWDGPLPLRAGISSFGMGGTNAHVIVEKAQQVHTGADSRQPCLLTLSARSSKVMKALVTGYLDFLAGNRDAELMSICYTAATGRGHYNHRLAVIADSTAGLIAILEKLRANAWQETAHLPGAYFYQPAFPGPVEINLCFSGMPGLEQAAGTPFMQKLHTYPVFRQALEECESWLKIHYPGLLTAFFASGPMESIPGSKGHHLLTVILQYCLTQLLKSWGINFSGACGSGIGNITANIVNERLTLPAGLKQVMDPGWLPGQASVPAPGAKGAITVCMGTDQPAGSGGALDESCFVLEMNAGSLVKLLSGLYVMGSSVNWDEYYKPGQSRRIAIPLYPFEKRSYWADSTGLRHAAGWNPPPEPAAGVQDLVMDTHAAISIHALAEQIALVFIDELASKLDFTREEVDSRQQLSGLGLDSVFVVNLIRIYEGMIQQSLDPTILFDFATIGDFAAYLAEEYRAPFTAYFSQKVSPENIEALKTQDYRESGAPLTRRNSVLKGKRI